MHILAFADWQFDETYIWVGFFDKQLTLSQLIQAHSKELKEENGWLEAERRTYARDIKARGKPTIWCEPMEHVSRWAAELSSGAGFEVKVP